MPDRNLSSHILPVSATMVGVCLTVISIIQLVETGRGRDSIIDNVLAFDTILFLLCSILSYLSIRAPDRARGLERFADFVFLLGLVLMVVASFMLAYELG